MSLAVAVPTPRLALPATRRILLATDLSPSAFGAERHALELARALGSELLIVSVIEAGPLAVGATRTGGRVDQVRARRETAAQALVQRGRELGVRVEFLVWEGEPGESIVEAAAAENADMVVIGSHGRGAVGSFFVGSVSAHVVRHAPCPVLVVRGRSAQAGT